MERSSAAVFQAVRGGMSRIDGVCGGLAACRPIYEDGAFYAVTYRNTNTMRQIARSPQVAAFAAWYDTANNEQDENCRILAIRLGRGTLNVNHWEKLYHMDFANRCMVDEP